jgi:hypothetical protein
MAAIASASPLQLDFFRSGEADQPVIVAYGGGVDSTAMLIELVETGQRIDMVLFADTGSEKPETYIYVWLFSRWLADRGVPLVVVRYEPQRFKHWPPYRSLDENCFTNGTLPSISFGRHSCSQKWKVEPQDKWTEAWEPAIACWARGGKVKKLIGYDAGARDSKRYAHAEGHLDPRFEYDYPLRRWGWDRERCEQRIREAGLPVPAKSACFMCGASQTWEIRALPAAQLRRIVLMEARAKPRLRNVEGLWRKAVQGKRGATPRPGDMTSFIRDEGLLPAEEIDWIASAAAPALIAFQARAADVPLHQRADLSAFMRLFDMKAAGMFDVPGTAEFYQGVQMPAHA